jgi:hypothetical protein
MKLKILVLLVALSIPEISNSQKTRTEMALYNIGLGSISSGIGAVINKEEDEKWLKVLLKGMGQGALGGYLIYESKNLVGKIEKEHEWQYGWYAKVVNSAGTSIVENAASNRDFWEQWNINFGFNRFEFHINNGFKFKYKILPLSFLLTSAAFITPEAKFEFKRTIQTGEFIFSNNNPKYQSAATFGNLFVIKEERLNDHKLIAHEIIHIYQYYDYNFVNTFFNKQKDAWIENSNLYKKLDKLLYFDWQAPVYGGLYLLENRKGAFTNSNFFEYEAGFYSRTNIWY